MMETPVGIAAEEAGIGWTRVLLRGSLEGEEGRMPVTIRGLSVLGALLEAKDPPAPGTAARLARADDVIGCRVAWSRGNRFAVRFDG